MTLQQCGIS